MDIKFTNAIVVDDAVYVVGDIVEVTSANGFGGLEKKHLGKILTITCDNRTITLDCSERFNQKELRFSQSEIKAMELYKCVGEE